jgi:hypothetical protein
LEDSSVASSAWSTWVKWAGTIEQTLVAGHHQLAGEATIADARARALKEGRASLLDVMVLTDRPFLGRCWVLAGDELHRYFGSKNPPKRAIEAGLDSFIAKLEEDQSVAVIAYTKGLPTAVLFAGRG